MYTFLFEPEFSTVPPLRVLTFIFSLHDLVNTNRYVCREVVRELREFCQPYGNFGENPSPIRARFTDTLATLVVNGNSRQSRLSSQLAY
jgi:hypothetical protein